MEPWWDGRWGAIEGKSNSIATGWWPQTGKQLYHRSYLTGLKVLSPISGFPVWGSSNGGKSPRGSGFEGQQGLESACQCRRCKSCGFDPWVMKILWKRKWHPTPVFFSGEPNGQRSLVSYSPWGLRARHDSATEHTHRVWSQKFHGTGGNRKSTLEGAHSLLCTRTQEIKTSDLLREWDIPFGIKGSPAEELTPKKMSFSL